MRFSVIDAPTNLRFPPIRYEIESPSLLGAMATARRRQRVPARLTIKDVRGVVVATREPLAERWVKVPQ